MQKLLLRTGVGLLLLLVLAGLGGWLMLRSSLPTLDGSVAARGLGAEVRIERDDHGVATVTAARRVDLAYGLGFAHGQDRLFQMDLLRRASAGELSALLGAATLNVDRQIRVHRFRAVARRVVEAAPPEERALLDAYSAGVNAGAASLGARPFEYLLLSSRPEPWRPEDSVLVTLTMFLQLQEADGHRKLQRGLITAALPAAAATFVYADAVAWDGALDGSHRAAPVIPAPAEYDLGSLGALDFAPPPVREHVHGATGSNNWAVAGRRTESGAALVANDMHLTIRAPNTWYRARLHLTGTSNPFDITGVTLPGTPAVVAGSNGHIAWGFTNSYGDFEDVVAVVPDPTAPGRYLSAHGSGAFTHDAERIAVRGGAAVDLDVVGTEWGPVIGADAAGRSLVLEWTAHDPKALNIALIALESAHTIDEAMRIAQRAGIPAQNFMVGDSLGHIGWTIAGRIPTRAPGDASVPRLSTDPAVGFTGWLEPERYPRIVDPEAGQLETANTRVVGGDALALLGDGGYDRGVRAARIAADLAARGDKQAPRDMLAVQLDDASLFLDPWRAHLVALLDPAAVAGHPKREELKRALAGWSGHAAIDDAAYRLVRAFRNEVEARVFYALIAPARAASPAFRFSPPPSFEGPLWALIEAHPTHLVPPGFANWREFELVAADAALTALDTECPVLAECTWGRANTMHIRHPLSAAVPGLSHLADMPSEPLPGDMDMPRVLAPAFGASERFGVSPGREAEGYFHMPGGQSGHPLSPYYASDYAAWAHGELSPFLPGRAQHVLTLTPAPN